MKFSMGVMSILVAGSLAMMAGTAVAAPSFLGPTGLIETPTADALDKDDYNLAVFTLNLEEGADSNIYAANLGLAEGLEVGFARHSPEDGAGETFVNAPEDGAGETFVNAKYTFSRETEANPAIAAGVMDFTDEVNTTTYVVLSKVLESRWETRFGEITAPRVHFGVGGGQLDGIFGGFSVALGERVLLMVEYDSDVVNCGARMALGNHVRAHVAVLDGFAFDDVGLGVSFNKSF
jgi:hypothetical protein